MYMDSGFKGHGSENTYEHMYYIEMGRGWKIEAGGQLSEVNGRPVLALALARRTFQVSIITLARAPKELAPNSEFFLKYYSTDEPSLEPSHAMPCHAKVERDRDKKKNTYINRLTWRLSPDPSNSKRKFHVHTMYIRRYVCTISSLITSPIHLSLSLAQTEV
jgi:hypothetical protein